MFKITKLIKFVLPLIFVAASVTACGPPQTLTDTITEEEYRQEESFCKDDGLSVDLQPGKIVCTGELDGQQVIIEIFPELINGDWFLQIKRVVADGRELAPEEYATTNNELAKDPLNPEEGYAVTSVIIGDNDITVVQTLK